VNVVVLSLLLAAPDAGVSPQPLIEVVTRIPDAVVDLRYATPDNFMGKAVYPPFARCLLLEKSLKQLEAARGARMDGATLVLVDEAGASLVRLTRAQ
jgi:D-alanyl-D-alanine dipeptidase